MLNPHKLFLLTFSLTAISLIMLVFNWLANDRDIASYLFALSALINAVYLATVYRTEMILLLKKVFRRK